MYSDKLQIGDKVAFNYEKVRGGCTTHREGVVDSIHPNRVVLDVSRHEGVIGPRYKAFSYRKMYGLTVR
jgi:hypothetical protein